MLFTNLKMQSLIDQFQNVETAKLNASLQTMIDLGLCQIGDMFFFSQKSQNISTESLGCLDSITQRYGDRSGFEKRVVLQDDVSAVSKPCNYKADNSFDTSNLTTTEKSMNSINIEDYESEDVVGQSLLLFCHLKEYLITHDLPDCTIFLSIQNSAEFGIMANVSFCISRLNESVIDVANIEGYEEAVMVEFVKS